MQCTCFTVKAHLSGKRFPPLPETGPELSYADLHEFTTKEDF